MTMAHVFNNQLFPIGLWRSFGKKDPCCSASDSICVNNRQPREPPWKNSNRQWRCSSPGRKDGQNSFGWQNARFCFGYVIPQLRRSVWDPCPGRMLFQGDGVETDEKYAFRFLKLAAEQAQRTGRNMQAMSQEVWLHLTEVF